MTKSTHEFCFQSPRNWLKLPPKWFRGKLYSYGRRENIGTFGKIMLLKINSNNGLDLKLFKRMVFGGKHYFYGMREYWTFDKTLHFRKKEKKM